MRYWIVSLVAVAACVAGFYAATSPQSIPPLQQPPRFDRALVSRGQELAAIGNCDRCHTAQDGPRLAGGRGIATPFGTIYSTNITPDKDTGLGLWSQEAFQRAMHAGISRDGHHLYPAFPYDHFTKVKTRDIEAIYAYLMSRPPVRALAKDNSLWFPLKARRLVAVWNWFFLKKGVQADDRRQTVEWNRGAYLVNGLGHCGACHTPRNFLGAERPNHPFAGGRAEGWDAYALNGASTAPVAWTGEDLMAYLRSGWQAEHGVALGPMRDVTEDLGLTEQPDVHAMSVYIASNMAWRGALQRRLHPRVRADKQAAGAEIYAASCAKCHEGGESPPLGAMDLASSSALNAPDPRNAILLALEGVPAADGRAAAMMPAFAGAISDEDLALLLQYLRGRFSGEPAWSGLLKSIPAARRELRMNGQS